jgi:nucleotide-binding universal stress UspA family protein
MNYKTVLVALDGGPRCADRVALGARLAAASGGHLVGLAATGLPDVIVSMNSAVPDAVECIQLSAGFLRERADQVARDFERQAAAAGAPSFEARVVEAEPLDAVVALGRCADLVVVGQTDAKTAVDGVALDFPQQVVLHTGTPVLVVPFAGRFETIGRRVLIAWKDTREAARAMHDALPFLRSAAHATLLAIGEAGADAAPDDDTLRDALAWLVAHGVAAEARAVTRSGEVGDALLSMASDLSCDLVVMGAYGHSRLHEWVLGGATRQMLAQMTVPVLMSH